MLVVSLWLAALTAIQIDGAGRCPAAAAVDERLAPLLAPGFAPSASDRAVLVEDADGALSVSLARADGRRIGSRRLPRAATCAEQAETVAVALAVWEAEIHPEISLRLDRLVAAAPPPPAAPPAAPTVEVRHVVVAPPRRFTAALGAALLGSWQPGSVAPGGRLDAMLGIDGRPWRGRLSVAGVGEHTHALPPGEASWWRLTVALGADYAIPLGRRWQLVPGAAAVAGVVTSRGSGFATDRSARRVAPGVEAGLRAELRLGAIRPWAGLSAVTWLRRQVLEASGAAATSSVTIPRAEAFLALGADLCW